MNRNLFAAGAALVLCAACTPQAQQEAQTTITSAAQQASDKAKTVVDSGAAQRYAATAQQWVQQEATVGVADANQLAQKVTPTAAQVEQAKQDARTWMSEHRGR
jgi:hypothetical protein